MVIKIKIAAKPMRLVLFNVFFIKEILILHKAVPIILKIGQTLKVIFESATFKPININNLASNLAIL